MLKLLGHYMSPYTRRVAVSLHTVGMPFELVEVSVIREPERVRPYNPVLRIPTVILDDGTPMVESAAILDEIDQMVGPKRALVPPTGEARRRVMQLTALAIASMEKCQWGYYERRFRPPEKVHQPWVDHNDGQCLGGLQRLETTAATVPAGAWLAGTTDMTQADITTAVVLSWMLEARPELSLATATPHLCAFARRCEATVAFRAAPMPKSEPGQPGVYTPK